MTCPIEQSLNRNISKLEADGARLIAIEAKAEEIQETLLDNKKFTLKYTGVDVDVDINDWFADFEAESDTITEFLKETSAHGNGQYLRNKMIASLEAYCEQLAINEVDNARG